MNGEISRKTLFLHFEPSLDALSLRCDVKSAVKILSVSPGECWALSRQAISRMEPNDEW